MRRKRTVAAVAAGVAAGVAAAALTSHDTDNARASHDVSAPPVVRAQLAASVAPSNTAPMGTSFRNGEMCVNGQIVRVIVYVVLIELRGSFCCWRKTSSVAKSLVKVTLIARSIRVRTCNAMQARLVSYTRLVGDRSTSP
jgi:hypothetical protein